MSLLEMSFAGGCIILAAVLLRALGKNRLPVGMFEALWALAWARLVLPVRLPFRFSVWALLPRAAAPSAAVSQAAPATGTAAFLPPQVDITHLSEALPAPSGLSPWTLAWALGAGTLALLLAVRYIRACRRFRGAEAVESDYVNQFLASHPLRRHVSVRVSDRVDAPLTYGVLRPVILLPRSMRLAEGGTPGYVLTHELAHIRRFDAARKPALAAAVCLHWFDPLVWVMYALACRDMERACDGAVLRAFGAGSRRDYALALLDMEERRAGFAPGSGFSKNAIEERIHSIMKIRPRSFLSILTACALVLGVGAAFATAAPEDSPAGVIRSQDGPTVYIPVASAPLPDASTQEVIVSPDGSTVYVGSKPASMTQQEYRMLFPSAEVEWWTAEEYAAWLEQEKKDLQACLGQRAWTSSDGWFTWTQEKIDETIEMYEQLLEEIENGLRVSKTIDGRDDVFLAQGADTAVQFSSAADTDTGWSADELYRGYSYTIADGDHSVTLGPYDTPEELREALEDEVDAWMADGRLTEEEAQGILNHFDPAPGMEQVFSPGGNVAYSFNGGESVELSEAERQALEVLLKNREVANAMGVTVDEGLYSVQTELAGDLQASLEALDKAIEPYLPFGLHYSYDVPTGEIELYWNGRLARGLYDGTAGVWITAHSGDGAWPEGTRELIAVYTDGELTGLRWATEQEQEQWDWLRAGSGIYGILLPGEGEPESVGTTAVPPNDGESAFFSQAEGPYGQLESGRRIRVAVLTAAGGSTVSVGLTSRTDASVTVSLLGDAGSVYESVELLAGQTQTISFSPEQTGAYELYLTNDGEYPVEFTVSYAVMP